MFPVPVPAQFCLVWELNQALFPSVYPTDLNWFRLRGGRPALGEDRAAMASILGGARKLTRKATQGVIGAIDSAKEAIVQGDEAGLEEQEQIQRQGIAEGEQRRTDKRREDDEDEEPPVGNYKVYVHIIEGKALTPLDRPAGSPKSAWTSDPYVKSILSVSGGGSTVSPSPRAATKYPPTICTARWAR